MNFLLNLLGFVMVLIFGFFAIFISVFAAIGIAFDCAIKEYGRMVKIYLLKIFGKEEVHP